MSRISRQQMLMQMAQVVAQRSTCSRSHVGAIAAIDSRPLVSGYNGAPAGLPHCDHTCDCHDDEVLPFERDAEGRARIINPPVLKYRPEHDDDCPSVVPCKIAVHAEANAIAFAARHGIPLKGSTLYVTVSPCVPCAQLIINAGIVEVVYAALYRDQSGMYLMHQVGITTCPTAG